MSCVPSSTDLTTCNFRIQVAPGGRRLLGGPSEDPEKFCARQNRLGFFPGKKKYARRINNRPTWRLEHRFTRVSLPAAAAAWGSWCWLRVPTASTATAHLHTIIHLPVDGVQTRGLDVSASTAARLWVPSPSGAHRPRSGTRCEQCAVANRCGCALACKGLMQNGKHLTSSMHCSPLRGHCRSPILLPAEPAHLQLAGECGVQAAGRQHIRPDTTSLLKITGPRRRQ